MRRGRGTILRERDLLKTTAPAEGDVLTYDATLKKPKFDGGAGVTGTKTFYTAASSGGSPTELNTVVLVNGRVISWTIGSLDIIDDDGVSADIWDDDGASADILDGSV